MPAILGHVARRVTPVLRQHCVTQRATVVSKPPKEHLGLVGNSIGFGVMLLGMLGPSAWIVAHIEDYKKRA